MLIVVENDPVQGTDTHRVRGTGPNPNPAAPPPTLPFLGQGRYTYQGEITDGLSTYVRIGGHPVALMSSRSTLDPGETVAPTGRHSGPQGSGVVPGPGSQAAQPTPQTLVITDAPLGSGTPSAGVGSALLTVDGTRVLLDGDALDTCSGIAEIRGATVTAGGQDFVSCSA